MEVSRDREEFHAFLRALDPDPDRGAEAFELLKRNLANFFRAGNCDDEFDLAYETFERVIAKVPDISSKDPAEIKRILFGFARNVRRENLKRQRNLRFVGEEALESVGVTPSEIEEQVSSRSDCLRACLESMSDDDRELVVKYFSRDGREKIEIRKKIADADGIQLSYLHTKVCRLKKRLRECILRCMAKKDL